MSPMDPFSAPPVVLGDDNPNPGAWQYRARIVRWTDGDTAVVDCLVDVGFEELVTKRRRIRLLGVDTPETRSGDPVEREAGRLAKSYVAARWPGEERSATDPASIVRTGTAVTVDVVRWDKYGGRDDGVILAPDLDGAMVSVADVLLEQGLAAPYDGGPR